MHNFQKLQEYLELSANKFPGKTALIYDNQKLTYKEINQQANAFADSLIKLGLQRSDRVVICTGNTVEAVIAFWGTLKAGGIVSIISNELKSNKVKYILEDSSAKFFIHHFNDNTFCEQLILPKNNTTLIALSRDLMSKYLPQALYFNDLISFPTDYAPKYINLDIDLASIIYTSGSTGEPKGVMLSHRNMLTASSSINTYLQHQEDDRFISALPLSFDYGLYQMILCFAVGATLILEKGLFLAIKFLKLIETLKPNSLPGVPSLFTLLGEHQKIKAYDLSSITRVTNTGAALTSKHLQVIKNLFPNAKIHSMYGLTECKRCTQLPPEDIDTKPQSVGKAIPNTEIWVIDNQGKKLPPEHIGQLVVRGGTVMQGYWNKPNETAEKLKPGLFPHEKVLYTGDYGWLDADGYFYFTARMDEMIKLRGQKVSPREIEDTIICLEGVKEVAVIDGEEEDRSFINVFISCNNNIKLDENTILEFCRKNLEPYKRPEKIYLLNNLPKNINGKIDKLYLKNLLQQKSVLT